jgi:hypothetical protein
MNKKDSEILNELEKEIGKPLPQFKPDEIDAKKISSLLNRRYFFISTHLTGQVG